MTRKRQTQIEALASKTLMHAQAYQLPVNLPKVAKSLDIDLIGFDFGDEITGCMLRSDDGRVRIGYNDQLPTRTVGRFAIAHSMGHHVLEHFEYMARPEVSANYYTIFGISALDHKSRSEMEQEREANAFAAALLMPADLVLVAIQKCANPADYLRADLLLSVADRCQVSPQLMALRLSTLCALW
ncbi:ImmA/IrrE family metallo-endopeptidase [Fibrella forsythiae]|uniref:ImmA/IrrE family metallo-endopeptidase n=1 Tax=Fibrella forsythiae TaxID=2817061 RepID=A0ABS3JBG0_9BACT|nr:ImmA/IrrE family metallo-endopeptidase [Fibrella forsythiae]MBO0947325.1 ImmA/IrrE family metallo-endopeptidase [Fibrella forsythiae]